MSVGLWSVFETLELLFGVRYLGEAAMGRALRVSFFLGFTIL